MKKTYSFFEKVSIALLVLMGTLTSCEKFLEVKPSKGQGIIISTTADLQALFNNYTDYYKVNDKIALFGADDHGLSVPLFNARTSAFTATSIQFSTWDQTYLAQNDQGSPFAGPNLWSGEYAKIFSANTVLDYLDKVTGSESDKSMLRAEAHFVRAYSYWELANTYCLPYSDATKNEPGLPIKTTPDYTIVGRSTLAETYAQITADLNEALKTTVPLTQSGINRNWRANTAGVNGFAARFYLNLNDYANALKYANASLALYNTLVDYNTNMRFGNSATATINSGTANQQRVTITFPYTHDDANGGDVTHALGWKETLYFRVLNNTDQWFIPSQDLISLYDVNTDLRYKYHYVQNYSYVKSFINPAFSYPGYVFFGDYGIPEGPTVAEMILIKAECEARTGAFASAMTTVNQLYSKRTLTGTPGLTASSQSQAIALVLQERRREMPFSQRWFDIRRFNTNNDPNDDVSLSRTFYPYNQSSVLNTQPTKIYTLAKGSRRFASPVPQNEVNNSNGLIKQNTY